jgi:hypothetical protein
MNDSNDLNKLNKLLFETLDGVIKKTKFEDKRVYAIVQLSNSIINNGKLQLAAYKLAKSEQTPQLFGLPEGPVQTPNLGVSSGSYAASDSEREKKEKRRLQTERDRHASMMGFANEKGFKNVADAMAQMTKTVFMTQFENWMNQPSTI